MSVLDKLVLVERKIDDERKPFNRKWRSIRISGFEKRGKFAHLVPAPETGISTKELGKKIEVAEMNQMVPASIMLEGGYVIFNGASAAEFHTDFHYRKKFREVNPGENLITPKEITGYKIVGVEHSETLKDEVTVICEGVSWNIPTETFDRLQDKIVAGNWLIVDGRWVVDAWDQNEYAFAQRDMQSRRDRLRDNAKGKERKQRREQTQLSACYTVLSMLERNNETELFTLLKTKCEEVVPDFAWGQHKAAVASEESTVSVKEETTDTEALVEVAEFVEPVATEEVVGEMQEVVADIPETAINQ